MKAEARKRLWFPGVDAALEQLAGACAVCAALRPAPPHAPLAPWPLPAQPFLRIHIDLLGPIHNFMFLIIVDAYSKWVECYDVSTTYNSKAIIRKLYDMMSRFGIPHTLVSDNGTSFTSTEFNDFCQLNGIKHILSPAYHPASNGQAESFVKIVKKGLKSIILEGCNKNNINEKIAKFLFDYRNSKNSTTDKSPAELVYGRPLRSRLDLINPAAPSPSSADLAQVVDRNQSLQVKYYKGRLRKELKENDEVWVTKNMNIKKFCWIKGVIKKKIGHVLYKVYLPELNCEVNRHIDQIRYRTDSPASRDIWDPDAVPDLPPAVVPSQGSEPADSRSTGEGGLEDSPATPPGDIASRRRQAISPIFSTPNADDELA